MALFVQHHQRTGGVKTQSFNLNRVDVGLVDRIAHRVAHRLPDIVRRLLNEVRFRTIQVDGSAGLPDHVTVEIEYPCARTSGAYIYANKIARHCFSPVRLFDSVMR
ncbi:hypothetical protein D3C72_2197440 [compost metagenome]